MSWLRPAAIYLMLTALIAGSIWLFWGKAIEQKWKQLSLETARSETKKPKLPEKKIPAKPELVKNKTETAKASPREEWQKTQSGFIALLAIEAADNRNQLTKFAEFNDNRWYELLRRPKPADAKPKAGAERPASVKPEEPRRTKLAERQPSKQKAR